MTYEDYKLPTWSYSIENLPITDVFKLLDYLDTTDCLHAVIYTSTTKQTS